MNDWITQVLAQPELCDMGHLQRPEDNNLGLGWLYYGMARTYRPRHVVCIGSWRGFVPMMFAKGMADNLESGRVTFIDPSMVDDFWTEPKRVKDWFSRFNLTNIDHHQLTTQAFVTTQSFANLAPVDLLFVDSMHTKEQASFDHRSFESLLSEEAVVLFHDSVTSKSSTIYGDKNTYEYTVFEYIKELKQSGNFQVFDIPVTDGLTLVRRA